MRFNEYTRIHELELFHWWYTTLHQIVFDTVARHAPPQPSVLDIGCGTGGLLLGLEGKARGLGCDLHPEALRLARTRRIRALRADATALPFADACADVVVSLDVLYHTRIAQPSKAMAELARVLRPGGIAIVNVPAYECLRSSHDSAVHTARRFTRAEVRTLLTGANLDPVTLTHWNTFLFPAAALLRILRRHRDGSDLRAPSPWSNRLLSRVLGMERRLIQRFPLPFGLSIFAVARKSAG